MNRRTLSVVLPAVLIICLLTGAGLFIFRPLEFFKSGKSDDRRPTRIIIPREINAGAGDSASAERMAYEDSVNSKIALEEGEIVISILTQDFDGDPAEEQVIAYRNLLEIDSPVYVSFVDYDEKSRGYRRVWDAPVAANRPGTISLYTQDLIGDRSVCIILTGMNGLGEHTMTIFRRNAAFREDRPQSARRDGDAAGRSGSDQPFIKIAELRIDGSIVIQETERPQAYQLGIARGQSFSIAAYGHDYESENILDQRETIYAFNPGNGLYEQSRVSRIGGAQVEQRRLRELLSGASGVFENFINDLWYYVSPQGALDNRQYIYFDPANRELIFFGDETQQIFVWQNSSPTRYGLYISSQNISVTTLRRFIDIELESLDSIKVKVFEDVRLKIGVSAAWDGSYRRAGTAPKTARNQAAESLKSNIDAIYDSSLGRMCFYQNGEYELSSGGMVERGRYVFFRVNDQELLEFRPLGRSEPRQQNAPGTTRKIYRVDEGQAGKNPSLSRVRLGTTGIQDLHEGAITLTPAEG
ncbi:MAG: pallilysin-related adhesin [Treponema sp.]|jgi:hypothetical protein|nr:pallilysin-related adhesin [Treponema sp.]